ncbi:SusC/RagA family TonB-linked outer membrane protein [Niabella sp.]|uniref:SusC/RagA family TonB-linked outer membrane protein n=1 Tax=Niabella sp. TaxID=1962976 RepID=UPI00260E6357|nr:SusC/RagA family TonB-linked outer membrane protein [Niabella sp.]
MKKKQVLFVFVALLLGYGSLQAQIKRTITGVITDADGKPVPGATITVKGRSQAAVANEKGEYSINVEGSPELEISSVGFVTKVLKVGSDSTLPIILNTDQGSLEGVVVTALGVKRQQRSLGYATSTVSAADLVKTAPTNFAAALYGKVPGLQVSSAPGGSTAGVVMQLRGLNSISYSSTPLIVLDGIPIRDGGFNSGDYWNDGRVRGNGLIDLNLEDMESVTVLKGAAAAALYGSEGKNGVLLLTSKKAKGKGFSVDFNATYFQDRVAYLPRLQNVRGAGFPVPYDVYKSDPDGFGSYTLNGTTYRTNVQAGLNFGPLFDGKPILTWDGQVRPYSAQPDRYANLFQKGNNSTQNIAVSSATDKADIRLSLTHQRFEGVSQNSKDEKLNANFNSTVRFSKNYSLDLMINYINQNVHNRPFLVDRMVNNFTGMMPAFDNGAWYFDKYRTSLGYKYVTGSNPSLTPDENIKIPNYRTDILDYVWNLMSNNVDEYNNRLISSITNTLKITNDLSLRGKIATDLSFNRTLNKSLSSQPIAYGPSGGYTQSTYNYNILYGDVLLNYNKQISEDFSLSATAGYTARDEKGMNTSVGTNGGLGVENKFDLTASYNTPYNSSGSQTYLTTDAFLGTLNFNYKSYAFLEGTIRRDRTSTMNPQNNTFTYPSVNGSLILSDIFKLPQVINYAKLRASWGVVGSYPAAYLANVAYNTGNLGVQTAGGTPVLTTSTITNPYGNDNIRPEKKKTLEFGLAVETFNKRLNFDVSYYHDKVYDLIINLTLPQSMGASTILSNIAELSNKGFEANINAIPIQSKDFRWNLTLNYFTNTNKIVKLANGSKELIHSDNDGNAYQIKSVVGQPVGDIYVHPTLVNDKGQAIITDDGLYQQDPNKMVSGGNSQVKGAGGILNTFTYKSFALTFNADFKYGGYVIPTGLFWMNSRGITEESLKYMDAAHGGLSYYLDANGKGIATTAASGPKGEKVLHDGMLLNGVTADGKDNTNIISQAYYYWNIYNWGGPQYSPSALYNLFVEKNNYIKMREISLAYTLPSRIASKVWAQRVTVSVFARNPFYIYRTIKDMDAEQLTTSNVWYNNLNNAGSQPSTRTFGAMIRATF